MQTADSNSGGRPLDYEEFSRQLDELGSEISATILAYEVYIGLQLTRERVDIINRHKAFFNPVYYALLYRVRMGLNRIFDRDPRTMSLTQLLRVAEKDAATLLPHLSNRSTGTEKMRAQLKPHKPLLDRLWKLQKQQLAHMDANITPLPRPKKREMDSLIETVKEVFRELRQAHKQSGWTSEFHQQQMAYGTSVVLHILMEDRQVSDRLLRESQGD